MSDSMTLETPLDVSSRLSKLDSPKIGSKEYQDMQCCHYRGIGCLNYLALTTRPVIAHTAIILILFVENPVNKHCNAAKACLRYLKGGKSEKLFYRKCDKLDLKGFLDSDWAGDLDSRKSGYCFKLDNSSGAISCSVKLQKYVSTSTAELNAVVEASKEVVQLANLSKEMNIDFEQPLLMFR